MSKGLEEDEGNSSNSPEPKCATALHHHQSSPSSIITTEQQSPSPNKTSNNNNNNTDDTSCIQVAVRVRPLLSLEKDDESCVKVQRCGTSKYPTAIQIGGSKGPRFTFDHVFPENTKQEQIFIHKVQPLIYSCLEGYNATILAYGQTGSGKTHTIMGPSPTTIASNASLANNNSNAGVIPRAVSALFQSLLEKKMTHEKETENVTLEYQISVQFLELYGEEIRDLLCSHRNEQKITIRDYGQEEPEVVGATQQVVNTATEALSCLAQGMLRRVTGATAMNESSSRSHAMFSIIVEQSTALKDNNNNDSDLSSDGGTEERVQETRSKFCFVDLAGAERQKRTKACGKRLQEGIDINKGLSNLGNVISALGDPKKRGKTHVPYRDAKLTRLLKGSLGGNHKTLMIACVSPALANMAESLNCLRYANRAKNIQNKAIVNVDANTRLVQELKGQVKALAIDLLNALDGNTTTTPQFTRESLISMLDGGKVVVPINNNNSIPSTPTNTITATTDATTDSNSKKVASSSAEVTTPKVNNNDNNNNDYNKKLEEKLRQTEHLLEQSQRNHDSAEKELHIIRAKNAKYETILSATDDGINAITTLIPEDIQKVFEEKAIKYEEEISKLKHSLKEVETKRNDGQRSFGNDDDDDFILEEEEKKLAIQRKKLNSIRESFEYTEDDGEGTYHTALEFDSAGINQSTSLDQFFEEKDGQDLAEKYLDNDDDDDDDDDIDHEDDATNPIANHDLNNESTSTTSFSNREPMFDTAAALDELSQQIEMKERLIEQIHRNKEREAMMKQFYEEKLEELHQALLERETERDQLLHDLEIAKEKNTSSDELLVQLDAKQKQIDALNQMKIKFRRQTAEASRNAADMSRLYQLQSDVKAMKKRKADMQKELAEEKRSHQKDVSALNKIVIQKDREISKLQRISNRHEMEAQKAKVVSKNRLDELAQLKKTLKKYKLGVGLDPVLVGRRQTKRTRDSNNISFTNDATDKLRDFFDKKVATVVRKEALVDKLAKEWENYFELNTRLKGINDSNNSDDSSDPNESIQALELQIEFKRDQIRKLAERVERTEISVANAGNIDDGNKAENFLFDGEISEICPGLKPNLATKVLFGMVVRERRRVAALAKTASSLDEQVQKSKEESVIREAAFRSYVEQHRREVTELEQKQQDHILSLMSMVSEESERVVKHQPVESEANVSSSSEKLFEKELLVLANERVAVLEDQLSEMRSGKAVEDEYAEKVNELNEILLQKERECEELEQSKFDMRTTLKEIRRIASNGTDGTMDSEEIVHSILVAVDDILGSSSSSLKFAKEVEEKKIRRMSASLRKKQFELLNGSDSEDEHSIDDDNNNNDNNWSSDLMSDLALIAEGKVPPSLNSPDLLAQADMVQNGIFDFSRDDSKLRNSLENSRLGVEVVTQTEVSMSSASFENSPNANDPSPHSNMPPVIEYEDRQQNEYQSVFDRLGSPSHFTGTQKEKFQDTKSKRERVAEEVADRLLGGILDDKNPKISRDKGERSNSGRTEYVKQNVFDRLQKTTTYSYDSHFGQDPRKASPVEISQENLSAWKERERPKLPVYGITDRASDEENKAVRSDSAREAYPRQNVFDRLQKTTTHAFAMRKNDKLQHLDTRLEPKAVVSPSESSDCLSEIRSTSSEPKSFSEKTHRPSRHISSDKQKKDYMRQNVFERLTKTTTEAYAQKTHRSNDN